MNDSLFPVRERQHLVQHPYALPPQQVHVVQHHDRLPRAPLDGLAQVLVEPRLCLPAGPGHGRGRASGTRGRTSTAPERCKITAVGCTTLRAARSSRATHAMARSLLCYNRKAERRARAITTQELTVRHAQVAVVLELRTIDFLTIQQHSKSKYCCI